MLVVNFSYFHKFIALSVITLIVYWLISIWSINIWQQVFLEQAIEKTPSIALKKNAQTINNKGKSLVFANVDLPTLPKKSIELIQESVKAPQENVQKIHKLTFKKQQVAQQLTHQVIKTETKGNTSEIYQQLVSDNSISIELAWPNETAIRQEIFTFLYQCIGMKFGVLNNQNVTLAKTFYQNVNANYEQQPSEWLRIAQGKLASQERLWLLQYNLSGTPVRLFPKVVDWQLAKLINNQLNGNPLKSLRAHYKYEHQRLMLINVVLNGQRLNNNWVLIENKCSI